MKRALVPLAAIGVALAAAAPASAHYADVGRHCRPVVFQPNTDSGASDIHARNVTCRRARRMTRRYANGDRTPFRFTCRSRPHDPPDGLAHRDVVCRRETRRVSWAAT